MRRLQSDLMPILMAAEAGELDKIKDVSWFTEPVVNVVLASQGYPGKYRKGTVIKGVETANERDDVVVFHAGTKRDGQKLKSNGGRVLNITASGETIQDAVKAAYDAIDDAIDWKHGFCRRDIAHHALKS